MCSNFERRTSTMPKRKRPLQFEDMRDRQMKKAASEEPHPAEIIPFPYEKKDICQTVTTYASRDKDVFLVCEHLDPSFPKTDDPDYVINRAVSFALETSPELALLAPEDFDTLMEHVDKLLDSSKPALVYYVFSKRSADSKDRIMSLLSGQCVLGITYEEIAIAFHLCERLNSL